MAQTLGIIDLEVDGVAIDVQKGATIKLAGYKQNTVNTGRRTDFAQEWVNGMVKATTVLRAGVALSSYLPNGEVSLTVTCDTGQQISIPTAHQVEPPEANGDGEGGKMTLEFHFGDFEELTNAG